MPQLQRMAMKSLSQVEGREGGTGFENRRKDLVIGFENRGRPDLLEEKGDGFLVPGVGAVVPDHVAPSLEIRFVHVAREVGYPSVLERRQHTWRLPTWRLPKRHFDKQILGEWPSTEPNTGRKNAVHCDGGLPRLPRGMLLGAERRWENEENTLSRSPAATFLTLRLSRAEII